MNGLASLRVLPEGEGGEHHNHPDADRRRETRADALPQLRQFLLVALQLLAEHEAQPGDERHGQEQQIEGLRFPCLLPGRTVPLEAAAARLLPLAVHGGQIEAAFEFHLFQAGRIGEDVRIDNG